MFSFSSFKTIPHGITKTDMGFVQNDGKNPWTFHGKINSEISNQTGIPQTHFIYPQQIHSNTVEVILENSDLKFTENGICIPNADGIITNRKDIVLLAKQADCAPIFFYDPKNQAIGLVHSGWKGTVAKIGAVALKKMMTTFGTKLEDIQIAIGPCNQKCCYNVNANDGESLWNNDPEWRPFLNKSDFKMDISGFIENMFLEMGVPEKNIEVSDICTQIDTNFYSWRRQWQQECKAGEACVCKLGVSFLKL